MRLYLPGTGTLGCEVWPGAEMTRSLGVPPGFYLPHMNVGPPILGHRHHHTVSSLPWLPVSAPPTVLDDYFFFKSLVVRLAYSLIFWQFWLFFCFDVICDPSYGCARR